MYNGSKTCYYLQKTLYLFVLFQVSRTYLYKTHLWGLIQHT